MTYESDCLTREQLYEQVWTEPMATLAKKYGLSDVGLAKICRKMRIPLPWRGYWQKKGAGKALRPTPLPKLPASASKTMHKVVFRRTEKSLNGVEASGPVQEQEQYESREENRIVVAEVLVDPHPLVVETVKTFRRAKPDERGYLRSMAQSHLSVHVTLDSADRAMCIFDALLKGLDTRGYTITIHGGDHPSTTVRIGEENIRITLEERVDRREQQAPATGKRQERMWSFRQYQWIATGHLLLRIDHSYLGIRCCWTDGKKQRLETCLNRFIVGLVAAAEALKTQRLAQEARERAWRAEEERRLAEERKRQEETSRIRALDHAATRWRKCHLLRDYIEAVRAAAECTGDSTTDTSLTEWIAWAEAYVNRIDPLFPVPSVPVDPEQHRPSWQRTALYSTSNPSRITEDL